MIFKANKIKSVRHASMLAKHLLRADENEIVEIVEIRGTARPEDLAASLRSMQRATDLTNGKTGLFSVAINPRGHEADNMTPEQWERSIRALEEEFNLAGQPCAIVRHRKNDRSHLHAVYQLTDTEAGKLIDIKFDKRRCQALGRSLEREFGHEVTTEEPSRDSYTRDEQQQAKRLGQAVPERREALRADFARAADFQDFQKLLVEKGYTLAKGDRAGAVLIDDKGEIFGLGRELGLKAGEVRKYIGAELDRLPTVEQVKNRLAVQKEIEPGILDKMSDKEREISDSQDMAIAMLDAYKTKELTVKAKFDGASYSFKFDQKLGSSPTPEPAKQPNHSQEISDSQSLAVKMLEQYRQKQADRERKMQEVFEQRDIADTAAEMLRKYREQQSKHDKGLDL